MDGLGKKEKIMIMHNFEYVPKEEWKSIREELLKIIRRLQNKVGNYFTFQYHFVGSCKRKMIIRDRNSNVVLTLM